MVYMESDRSAAEAEVKQAVYEGTHLQPGDFLDIKVTAYDEFAVRPFNLHSMNQLTNPNEGGSAQTGQTAPQGYLVDSEGYIIFPVLGKIFVKGMTMGQLRADLESKLLEYLSDPLVSIRQLNFNITVLGEVSNENGIDQTHIIDFTDRNITGSPYYYMQQNDVLYVEPDIIKRKSANVDPNRNLAFQIGGVVLGLAGILITLLK